MADLRGAGSAVGAADMNSGGAADVLATDQGRDEVAVHLNTGRGGEPSAAQRPATSTARAHRTSSR